MDNPNFGESFQQVKKKLIEVLKQMVKKHQDGRTEAPSRTPGCVQRVIFRVITTPATKTIKDQMPIRVSYRMPGVIPML